MILAHILGVPVEEFLTPATAATVSAALFGAATAISRLRARLR